MSRRSGRDTVFRLLYEYSINGGFNPATVDVMRDCFDKGMNENAWDYVNKIIDIYEANNTEIDALIQKNSKGWSIGHMSKVDLAILRLGVCEIKYIEDIHPNITINECVEIAKRYSTEKSSKFINGVLAGILNTPENQKTSGNGNTGSLGTEGFSGEDTGSPKTEGFRDNHSGDGSPDE